MVLSLLCVQVSIGSPPVLIGRLPTVFSHGTPRRRSELRRFFCVAHALRYQILRKTSRAYHAGHQTQHVGPGSAAANPKPYFVPLDDERRDFNAGDQATAIAVTRKALNSTHLSEVQAKARAEAEAKLQAAKAKARAAHAAAKASAMAAAKAAAAPPLEPRDPMDSDSFMW